MYSKTLIEMGDYNGGGLKGKVIRGYHPKRSGDLVLVVESGWLASTWKTGSTHGSGYQYDTHVPILFYGKGVKQGSSSQYHSITDIAPTVSRILKISYPSGSTGQPISEMLDWSKIWNRCNRKKTIRIDLRWEFDMNRWYCYGLCSHSAGIEFL